MPAIYVRKELEAIGNKRLEKLSGDQWAVTRESLLGLAELLVGNAEKIVVDYRNAIASFDNRRSTGFRDNYIERSGYRLGGWERAYSALRDVQEDLKTRPSLTEVEKSFLLDELEEAWAVGVEQ